MFKTKNEMTALHRANVRGGNGAPEFRYLFSPEEMGGRVELLGVITLAPGESVGMHPHETNAEAYYIIAGEATVTENGEARILKPGDAEFCAGGDTHSIANHTDAPVQFLAVIVPNR